MAVATDPRLEEVRKIATGRGVEFFFAQFVDMYGRPSAKLVPAANLDDLATDGAGFARFACDVTVEGEPWPYCPRTILRNQLARAKELGYDYKIGLELEYFLVQRNE